MAGLSWFELEIDFPDHPKSARLAVLLKNPVAFGWAVRLWAYCYRHATDRFKAPGAAEQVEHACGWRGKPGVLVEALVEVKYLTQDGDDLVAHGVEERLAPHLAKRDRDAERARQRRADAAASLERRGDVEATTQRRPPDVRRNRNRDSNRDDPRDGSVQPSTVSVITGGAGGKA